MDDSVCLNLTLHLVPFFDIFRDDMKENIDRLAKDLDKCCSENPDVEVIHTGSGVEGLSLPHLDKSTWNTDADHMIIRTDLRVQEGVKVGEETNLEESEKLSPDASGSCMEKGSPSLEEEEKFLYIYDAAHSGYVYLTHKKLSQPRDPSSIRDLCIQNAEFIEKCQHLIPLSRTALMATADVGSIIGPSYSLPYTGGSFIVNRDFVYGLKCPFWPSQAEEWIHRDRVNWPRSEAVSAITNHGCHVVPVGSHNSNLREYEWRFSFSVAELMLVNSLSETQKLTYSMLKALIKSEMKLRGIDLFASYHLKTCLFWFLEKKGTESWETRSSGVNILELLDSLITFYSEGFLPNYFILKNNMIDHHTGEDVLTACHALREIRDNVALSFCRYIENNQSLPVSFDVQLTQLLRENPEKFAENCKYNFLVMALACVLKKEKMRFKSNKFCVEACGLVDKARLLHKASQSKDFRASLHFALVGVSEVSEAAEKLTANVILSLLEEFLAVDNLKVTENSAVALAVFNVFLTLHPTHLAPGFERNSAELQSYLRNPVFKETLFWAARMHETYSDAIYDFVVEKWKNGPRFHTENDEAKKFLKLLMIILGKPTKQARAVTGSLVKRAIEGERFIMMRMLGDYLLHVHLDSAYIAFQAAAYLMGKSVLSEVYLQIKWSTYEPSKLRAIQLILSKPELQAEFSEEEFARLLQMHHELT